VSWRETQNGAEATERERAPGCAEPRVAAQARSRSGERRKAIPLAAPRRQGMRIAAAIAASILLMATTPPCPASEDGAYRSTPLIDAISSRDDRRIDLLLTQGADVNEADSEGVAPLAVAAMSDNQHLVDRLLRLGANIDRKTLGGASALMQAAAVGADATALLLEKGADPCARDIGGKTALDRAEWAEKTNRMSAAAVILRRWFKAHPGACG